ncbi:hypothetical protein COU80_02030 [Candidatus Peregrinibacteria bacterium CG10_big_fil_rev_8_21_14_0_10_55_24]|nr:MAG: hypothetical protein COU80_02030 [Candidatus Peregrinibacteria bacterium CG10_big_fil_rev_8_21_14_0_10_55_24]
MHPSASPHSAPTEVGAARTQTQTDALAMVDAAETEDTAVLPVEVQTEIDELTRLLLEEAPADHGKGFNSTPEYRQRAVRAAALLREYLGHASPLSARAGVLSTSVQRYMERDGTDVLTPEETQAIATLSSALEGSGQSSRIGEEDGKKLLALVRLLRKGKLDEQLRTFREQEHLTVYRLSKQEKKHRLVLTKNLVPELFSEEGAPSVSSAEPLSAVPGTAPEDAPVPETNDVVPAAATPEAPKEEASPTSAASHVTAPSNGEGFSPAKLSIIDRLTAQNERVLTALMDLEPHDERIAALASLMEQNRALLGTLGVKISEQSPVPVEASPVQAQVEAQSQQAPLQYLTPGGGKLEISRELRGVLVLILEGKETS